MAYLEPAKDYLFNDDDALEKTLIGGGINLLSIFIIPIFIYQGYLLQILKDTEDGNPDELPEWDNWRQLFKDGLIAFTITLLLYIPLIGGFIAYLAGAETPVILILAFSLSFVFSYFTPALLTMVMRDSTSELTNISRLTTITFSAEYFKALLLIFILSFAIGIVFGILQVITFGMIGIAVPFLFFPLNCAFMHIIGSAVTNIESENTQGQPEPSMEENNF